MTNYIEKKNDELEVELTKLENRLFKLESKNEAYETFANIKTWV
jgi:hypothetical protein